jgi:hypothetical protein
LPLGSVSDELAESGVEAGYWRWVFMSVGFPEDGMPFVVFDLPSVLMEEPVVKAA